MWKFPEVLEKLKTENVSQKLPGNWIFHVKAVGAQSS